MLKIKNANAESLEETFQITKDEATEAEGLWKVFIEKLLAHINDLYEKSLSDGEDGFFLRVPEVYALFNEIYKDAKSDAAREVGLFQILGRFADRVARGEIEKKSNPLGGLLQGLLQEIAEEESEAETKG